jgi:hypothetical protein
MKGDYGTYSNIINYKRKVGFDFGDVVLLKNHLVDTRRFYYAGIFYYYYFYYCMTFC